MFDILFETRPTQSKSGLETETSRPRLHPCSEEWQMVRVKTRTVMRWQLIDEENHEERIERRRKWCRYI